METHLVLGGMHVDVHLMRIDLQIQHVSGLLIVLQLILIGLTNGVIDQTIAHHAAVDVTILHFTQLARPGRIRHPTADAQIAVLPVDVQRMLQKRRAADAAQTALVLAFFLRRPVLADQFAVVAEVDRHIEARQRDAPHHFIDMAEFGFLGAHELAARRGVVKQIQHFQRAADRVRGGFDRHRLLAPFGIGLPRFALVGGARRQSQTGYRTDAGQRFAAKAEADDRLQVVERADFTGGVPRQRQRQIVLADATTVVANADQLGAAAFDIDIDARRPGVQAVFHQLFDDRRGALNHLSGGDLVGELWR